MSSNDVSRRAFLATACRGSVAAACGGLLLPDALASLPIVEATGREVGQERAYPIPAADSVTVDRAQAIILVRHEGRVFVLGLTCPHQNAAVKWLPSDGRFQCTKHDSKYNPDGVYIAGRSTRNLDRFAIRREGGSLFVNLNKVIRADQDPAGWAAAELTL